jgi:tetratricopeptide (TPR) repeat protein
MSISKQILEAKNFFQEYKLDLCIQTLNSIEIEKIGNLEDKIQIIFYNLQGNALEAKENYEKAFFFAEKSYLLSNNIENCIEKVDSFLLMANILMKLKKFDRSSEFLHEANILIRNLPKDSIIGKKGNKAFSLRIKAGINYGLGEISENVVLFDEMINIYKDLNDSIKLADAYSLISSHYYYLGELNKSLDYIKEADEIFSKIEIPPMLKKMEIGNYIMYGAVYDQKGEMGKALEFTEKALQLAKKYNSKYQISTTINNLACFYQNFANWDKSIEYFKIALDIAEKAGDNSEIAEILEGMIISYLNKEDIISARFSFEKMTQIHKKEDNKRIDQLYRYCNALILKKSTRTRDLGIAQKLLNEITQEEINYSEVTIGAMIYLSEMLLFEFEESKDPEILKELVPLIEKLHKTAETQHSYLVIAETFLLKSKLALISLNLDEARKFLNQGQIISEKYGLNHLAMKISNENDDLIKNLEIWKTMQIEKASISKILRRTNINHQINSMLGKTNTKFIIPEINDEDPVLIMILSGSGVPIFSKIFKEEWSVNEELFAGFLTAFNSFSDEIFSKGFDRAVFGDYAILMRSLDPFMISYIFKGQSYLAKQKFSKFSKKIKESKNIWKIILHSMKTGRFLRPKQIPDLEILVDEIFISKNPEI